MFAVQSCLKIVIFGVMCYNVKQTDAFQYNGCANRERSILFPHVLPDSVNNLLQNYTFNRLLQLLFVRMFNFKFATS